MSALNLSLFHWINGWSNSWSPFYDFLSEGSKWTWMRIVFALIAIALIVSGPQTRKAAIFSLVGFPIANWVTDLFKHHLPMPRPCVELNDVIYHGIGFLQSAGTASAHSANTAVIAVVMVYFLKKWGLIPIAISLFTGISRIYGGVHYPYQVLLGWSCGVAVGLLLIGGWRIYENRRKTSSERNEVPEATDLPALKSDA